MVSTVEMAAIIAVSSDNSECGSSSGSVVSLLDMLKSPTPTDIGRARKLKTNPPPVGKQHCKRGVTSDPKRVVVISAFLPFIVVLCQLCKSTYYAGNYMYARIVAASLCRA